MNTEGQEGRSFMMAEKIIKSSAAARSADCTNTRSINTHDRPTSLSSGILRIFSPRASPCALFEVKPVLFVPHAARSCCRLFYKSIAMLTSLVFYQFLCRMSLCRVPGLQRGTRYSIHGITGGHGHRGDTTAAFIASYQTRLFRLVTQIYHVDNLSE